MSCGNIAYSLPTACSFVLYWPKQTSLHAGYVQSPMKSVRITFVENGHTGQEATTHGLTIRA
jgi:hypothetical protein